MRVNDSTNSSTDLGRYSKLESGQVLPHIMLRAPKNTIQGMLLKEQGAVCLSENLLKQIARFAATKLKLPVTVYLQS